MSSEAHGAKRGPRPFGFASSMLSDVLLALLAAGVALVLYLRTLAPGLLPGDSGELQFAAWLAGFVHPTGYPLYLMLGWLWTHLVPWHEPAWRLNAFSALWGAIAVGLVYLLARRALEAIAPANQPTSQPPNQLVALFAALTFAVTPTFWSQAVIAEVYTLNAAFVAAVLLGLVLWGQTRGAGILYGTALVYGLSLTHHRSMLLLAPAAIVYLLLLRHRHMRMAGLSEAPTSQPANQPTSPRPRGLILALCVFLPLALYAYIPLRAPQAPYANVRVGAGQVLTLYEPTLRGFLAYVAGQTFSGEIGPLATAIGRAGTAAGWLVNELTWLGVGLGLVGLARLARRNRPLLALTGLAWVAVVVFNLSYGIGDIYVFYVPAYLIWVLWAAVGLAATAETVGRVAARLDGVAHRREPTGLRSGLVLLLCLLGLCLPAYLFRTEFTRLDRSRDYGARTAWESILSQPIPPEAILVTNDRDEMMPLWYMQYVEGRRPDLAGLFPLIQPTSEWADVGAVTDQALRSGRPTYLIKPMPGLEIRFRLEPSGPLVRVLGPAASKGPDHAAAALYDETLRLIGYDISPDRMSGSGLVAVSLYWLPMRPLSADYTAFVHLLNADGQKVAQSDHRPGGIYYPTSLWKPGETLVDLHVLSLPPDPGRAPYSIVVGLYTGTADLKHLGQPQPIGAIGP